ncbi:MAG: UDP-glucose/GDP-mannose dehydrogenase family protein [Holophagales bacterium]|jgi:UDPglucose 6-dehydrogenase|nr:UDP-glucose/GDP-mannose dehydrogenase family protein [Holophagales bacterium]
MQVLVIGSGYVGLVAAAGFADAGHQVIGVDVDSTKIEMLNKGKSPIYEPGLEELLTKHLTAGSIKFTTDVRDGIAVADAAFICVGTPQSEDGSADLQYVLACAGEIGAAMTELRPESIRPLIVIDKSTVPVGTATKVSAAIRSKTDRAFEVVSNPEFLREGTAIEDFLYPDRVVIGCNTDFAESVMQTLYNPHLQAAKQKNPNSGRWFRMDPQSAELTKYAANAMLAIRISFINEMANLCEAVGADIDCVKNGIGADHRIGPYFLNPGPGFGGSCFPKDLQALLKTGRENGLPLMSLNATVEANRHQKQALYRKVCHHYKIRPSDPYPLSQKRMAVWGLAFKAHTDDIRESTALELIKNLLCMGAEVAVHDYEAMPNIECIFKNSIQYAKTPIEACQNADAVLICTEWPQYSKMDLDKVASAMKSRTMFDGRNLFNPYDMKAKGWTYHSIGRRSDYYS